MEQDAEDKRIKQPWCIWYTLWGESTFPLHNAASLVPSSGGWSEVQLTEEYKFTDSPKDTNCLIIHFAIR